MPLLLFLRVCILDLLLEFSVNAQGQIFLLLGTAKRTPDLAYEEFEHAAAADDVCAV